MRIHNVDLHTLQTVVRNLGYEPYNQKSWEEFDHEDYYRILKSLVKQFSEEFGY